MKRLLTWWARSSEFDPFDEQERPRLTLRERSWQWFSGTRFGYWLEERTSARCGLCGAPVGFAGGGLCASCYGHEKMCCGEDW